VVPPTETMVRRPQQLLALERANAIRRARAELKRRISDGQLSAAELILNSPVEASSWPVADVLASQQNWGSAKSQKFLSRHGISELKRVGELTERQRRLLAGELRRLDRAESELFRTEG
jgi:hypothetical protein